MQRAVLLAVISWVVAAASSLLVVLSSATGGMFHLDSPSRLEGPDKHQENPIEAHAVHNVEDHILRYDDDFIRIKVNETVLERSGDWLEVSWSGSYTPSYWDYIGVMIPADADVRTTAIAKYKLTRNAEQSPGQAQGPVLRFRMLNMRQPFRFVLFTGSMEYPVAIAHSPIVAFKNYNEPLQGHLALAAAPGEVKVQWVTRDAGSPQVWWGEQEDDVRHTVNATTSTYTREDLCGEPATSVGWMDPGSMHQAVISGLKPGIRYFYKYGDDSFGYSPIFSFVGPPLDGPEEEVLLLHVADMGQAEVDGSNELSMQIPSLGTAQRLREEISSQPFGLVVHNGDISYARGYGSQWEVFYDQIQPVATALPWMTSPGNHERDHPFSGDRFDMVFDSGGECGVPYDFRTGMPHRKAGQQWYAFNYGPIHFLQMSTEQPFGPGSPQLTFIASDLSSVNRTLTPWVIVGAHRPFYVSSTYQGPKDSDGKVSRDLRLALEPLFMEMKVDLVLNGHHHSYQRTCPIFNETCVPRRSDGAEAAPTYVVAGHAGASLCKFGAEIPSYWQVMHQEFGYMRIRANARELAVEAVRNSDPNSLMDQFTLRKSTQLAAGLRSGSGLTATA